MQLKKIELTNFMLIHHAVIQLDNQGLILVKGDNQDSTEFRSNGAGKTSIFNGISFALFEKTTKDLSANDYINEDIGKGLCVILDFVGDDKHSYRIIRHRKDSEFKNDTLLFRDKENITAKSNKDTNELIEKIIHIDFLTFTNSILFGQGILKTFTVATDAEKKKILDKILKLDIWSRALEESKADLKNVNSKLSETEFKLESRTDLIESKKESIEQIKLKAENQKQQIKDEIEFLSKSRNEERENASNKVDKLQKEIDSYDKELHGITVDTYLDEVRNIDKQLDQLEEQVNDLKTLESKDRELKANISNLISDKRHLSYKINDLKKKYKEIKSGVGKSCPVCGQEITDEGISNSLDHIVQEGKNFKSELSSLSNSLEKLLFDEGVTEESLKVKDELENKQRQLVFKKHDLNEKVRYAKKQKQLLMNNIDRLSSQIKEIEEKKEIKRLELLIQRKREDLDSKSYLALVYNVEDEVKELDKRLSELKLAKMDLISDKKNLEFAVSAFGNSGIKSYILDSVTPYLNKRANYYISKLTGGTTEIEFTTQTKLSSGEYRDKFDVKISNHIGGSSYKKNSTGERKRVDLAISLALQDLVMNSSNSKFNFLLYDECFDGLDDIGCENVIELLQEMQKKIPSIFVITHNDTLKSFFEHSLLVTKKNKVSTVKRVD